MPEYQYVLYNVRNASNMSEMSNAGWHVHTCLPNYTEFACLWERALPGETVGYAQGVPAAAPAEDAAAPDQEPAAPEPVPADPFGHYVPPDGSPSDPATEILRPKDPPLPPG